MSHRDILDIAASSPAREGTVPLDCPPDMPEDPAPHWNDVDVVAASFCAADWRALSEDAKRSYRLAAKDAIRALEARRSAASKACNPSSATASRSVLMSSQAGAAPAKPAQAVRAALVAAAVSLGAGAALYPAAAPFLSSLDLQKRRGPDRQTVMVPAGQHPSAAAEAHGSTQVSSR